MVGMPELQEQIPALQRAPARAVSTAALLQEIAAAVNGWSSMVAGFSCTHDPISVIDAGILWIDDQILVINAGPVLLRCNFSLHRCSFQGPWMQLFSATVQLPRPSMPITESGCLRVCALKQIIPTFHQ